MNFLLLIELLTQPGVEGVIKFNSVTPDQPKPNWPLLAALRFVLALIVALDHLSQFVVDGTYDFYRQTDALRVAVGCFFIISGFSIAASYRQQPVGFLKRRAFRILPVYWVGMLLSVLPFIIWGPKIPIDFGYSHQIAPPLTLIKQFLLLQPAFCEMPGFNWSLWSVTIEFAFYLLVPVLAPVRLRWWGLAAGTSILIFIFGRFHLAESQNLVMYGAMFWLFALGWIFYHIRDKMVAKIAVSVLLPVTLLCVYLRAGEGHLLGLVIAAIITILIAFQDRLPIKEKGAKAVNYLGDLSFPLYAIHAPVGWVCNITGWTSLSVVALCFSVALSVIVLHTIDRPLRLLGRRGRSTLSQDKVTLVGEYAPR